MSLRTGLAAAVMTTVLAHMPLPATAAMPTPGIPTALSSAQGLILQVHSRKRVHDALHAYGYERVTHRRTRYDYNDRPGLCFFGLSRSQALPSRRELVR